MNAIVHERKLVTFLKESNAIEGIFRDPTAKEITVLDDFLKLSELSIANVENLVNVFQPGAGLRMRTGMDVRVGDYTCPRGGIDILDRLEEILADISGVLPAAPSNHPYAIHQSYLDLHPFMDGNGRSARAIWLWQMAIDNFNLPFLQWHYYETLSRNGPQTNK